MRELAKISSQHCFSCLMTYNAFFDKASRYRFFSLVNGKKSWLNYFTQRKRGREVLMWDFSWVCNQLIKDKSNLLNLCLPVGDPGYYRTAQAEQRNVQQGLQQLLLQGGRPHPGLTGQSLLSRLAALSSQLVACCSVTHGRPAVHHMSCACSCSTVPEQLSIYGCGRVVGANRINKFFSSLTLADVASGGLSLQSSLSWPNREGWSLSVYKTLMDLLWPTLGWMSGVEHRKAHQKVLTDTWR